MVRGYITSAVAGALLLGLANAALAVTGEFDNMCTMGLASGKDIQTDCSVNAQVQGKTYCFGSKEAMTQFMADPSGNLAKAQTYYSKKHPRLKPGPSIRTGISLSSSSGNPVEPAAFQRRAFATAYRGMPPTNASLGLLRDSHGDY
jgi:YHS domain-containing protein